MTASKFSCFILVLLAIISLINCLIINENVEQNIDLTSQLAKKQIKITAKENNGKSFSEYTLNLQPTEWSNVAFIAATSNSGKKLKLEKKLNSNQYILNFEKPQLSHSFTILMVFTKIIIPYPESIRQTDKQFVSYSGTLYFYSPYATKTQSTNIKLSSTNVLSYSQVKPVSLANNKIFYGPFENIEANRNETLKIHYENETPFLNVKELHREIEVSHWGNIALKENIMLFHSGAKLKGSFSRYDFQKDGRGGLSAVKSIKTLLPSSSSDIYYRDGNGNISTSNMKVLTDSVELELRPRFPLFGGWKTQYTLGYNVPSFEYLFNTNEKYVLKMRTIDHIFDEMVVEKATIKVILPEGSSNIRLKTPYPVDRQANSLHYTYLDTVGRPVISFSINNLVQNHIEDFQLSYNFSKTSLLQEPILIICFIFFVFILTIIFMRLDFSISPHSHKE